MSGHMVSSTKGFRGLGIWGIRSTALWWEAEKQPRRPGPKGFSQACRLPLPGIYMHVCVLVSVCMRVYL